MVGGRGAGLTWWVAETVGKRGAGLIWWVAEGGGRKTNLEWLDGCGGLIWSSSDWRRIDLKRLEEVLGLFR
ncbi:MAG: hypothetical protein GF381_01655 [Candidatus Pacebacteria bacterium]|nr:hypothetical protein [Candidatus Paceibacterota bacterium]